MSNINSLLWLKDTKMSSDKEGCILLNEKPNLGFDYFEMVYLPGSKYYDTELYGDQKQFSEEQIKSIEEFIENLRKSSGKNVHCVDSDGFYLGYFPSSVVSNFYADVENSPPGSEKYWAYDFTEKNWKIKYFYDENGKQCEKSESFGSTFEVPISAAHIWNIQKNKWELSQETLVYLNEKAQYDMTKCFIIGVLSHLYNEKCSNPNIIISDYLKHLNDSILNSTKTWVEKNVKDDYTMVGIERIIENQLSMLSDMRNDYDVDSLKEKITEFNDLSKTIKSSDTRVLAASLNFDYPSLCDCKK